MFSFTDHLTGNALLTAVNLTCGIAILFFGYDQGMMAGVNNSDDYIRTMGLGYIAPGDVPVITHTVKQGGIIAIYYLGTLIGCLVGGIIGDKYGRTNCILFGCCWGLLGSALQCSAQNVAWMCCARIINGVGTGALNGIVPVWGAEVSEHKTRGGFVALEFTLNIFGVVVAYWIEYGLQFIEGGKTQFRWRFPIAFQMVFLIWLLITTKMMPESPRWLISQGRNEEARYILGRLRAKGDMDDSRVVAEYEDIVAAVKLEKATAGNSTYYHMMTGKGQGKLHTERRVQLAVWLMIIEVWDGIAAITIWAPTIFRAAGYSTKLSTMLGGVNTISYMLATFVAVFTLDRVGRRATLFWGSVIQAIGLFLAGGFSQLALDHPEKGPQYGGAATFFVFLYTFAFGATWLTVPWLYPTEIFPLNVRAKGQGWGVVGWSIGFGMTTLLIPQMFNAMGSATLYVFGAVNILSIPVVWALYPETSQRTLEEIDLLFASDSMWVWNAEKEFQRQKAEHTEMTHLHTVEASGSLHHRTEHRGSVPQGRWDSEKGVTEVRLEGTR